MAKKKYVYPFSYLYRSSNNWRKMHKLPMRRGSVSELHKHPKEYKNQCPICKSRKYEYTSESEPGWGTVEQHGSCRHCGYVIEQAYSHPYGDLSTIRKGWKDFGGIYHPKDSRKHKRVYRKLGIKFLNNRRDPYTGGKEFR